MQCVEESKATLSKYKTAKIIVNNLCSYTSPDPELSSGQASTVLLWNGIAKQFFSIKKREKIPI